MIGIGFLICVFGIGIINLLLPSKKISEEENRGLQQKPELSVSAVTSGSYMDQYEKYQADQFMGRNMWRSLKVGFSRLAGSKEGRLGHIALGAGANHRPHILRRIRNRQRQKHSGRGNRLYGP